MAPLTVNLEEWSAHLISRLRREAAITGDARLDALRREVEGYPGVEAEPPPPSGRPRSSCRCGSATAGESSPSSRRSQRSAPPSTSRSSELSIEAFYPANAATATRMLSAVADV